MLSLRLALFALLLSPAFAKPAECLVVVENKTYLDGPCEFRSTNPGGSFEIAAGPISASVTVYPDGGMAIFTDVNQDGGAPSKLGDVKREGACWVNRISRICSWAPGGRPARTTAPAAKKLYPTSIAKIGDWEIVRYTRDAAKKQFAYCTAIIITGQEQAIRVEINPKTMVIGFMGEASEAIGSPAKVSYWFGDRRSTKRTPVTAKLLPDAEDINWLSFSQLRSEPGGAMDELMNTNAMHFTYTWQGKPIVQSFALKNSNAALKKLFACGEL